jgi:hypothetical protein
MIARTRSRAGEVPNGFWADLTSHALLREHSALFPLFPRALRKSPPFKNLTPLAT